MDSDSRPKRFQFSMATGLIVVSGLSVVFSLTVWQPLFGGMTSSLIVGTWWTHAAVRAGHRRLAYYLAAWPMGTVVFAVGCCPTFVLLFIEEFSEWHSGLLFLTALAIMCIAYLLTILLLRRMIRHPRSFAKAGILSVYLAAALFVVLLSLCTEAAKIVRGGPAPTGSVHGVPMIPGVVYSVIWSTIVFPVAWPVGIAFSKILQGIDPGEIILTEMHWSILRIVDRWQVERDGPLEVEQVAERRDIRRRTAAARLYELHHLGILEYKKETGYHRDGSSLTCERKISADEEGRLNTGLTQRREDAKKDG